jgi:hypothetical protein
MEPPPRNNVQKDYQVEMKKIFALLEKYVQTDASVHTV